MVKKEKKTRQKLKNDLHTAKSAEMTELVEQSIGDMRHYEQLLAKADNPEEAQLRIKQMYFNNLKQAGMPMALAQRVLADLLTRLDIKRIVGKEVDPLSPEYLKVLKQVNENIKLVKDMEGKAVSIKVSRVNDQNMNIIDAEVVSEMFTEDSGE